MEFACEKTTTSEDADNLKETHQDDAAQGNKRDEDASAGDGTSENSSRKKIKLDEDSVQRSNKAENMTKPSASVETSAAEARSPRDKIKTVHSQLVADLKPLLAAMQAVSSALLFSSMPAYVTNDIMKRCNPINFIKQLTEISKNVESEMIAILLCGKIHSQTKKMAKKLYACRMVVGSLRSMDQTERTELVSSLEKTDELMKKVTNHAYMIEVLRKQR